MTMQMALPANLHVDWILCEATTRWAAALRTALARDKRFREASPRLREVRRLGAALGLLEGAPAALVLVEVTEGNLRQVLEWLPPVLDRHAAARAVALIAGRELLASDVMPVLYEAGFRELSTSPRDLSPVLEAGWRFDMATRALRQTRQAELPLTERVWTGLPWQRGETPVG